ncbi:MAG: hypothetical protein H6624_08935 [Bdellovibrionaceae bacterium]|nr:hypothetical protein [Bdellovibrionales bacterium]MCB9084458.1 hypothetical protein [Pseudobdellovibrionaceae bacterium]
MILRSVFLSCLIVGSVFVFANSNDDVPKIMKSSPPIVQKDDLEKLSKWPIFKDMVWDNVYMSQVFNEGPSPTDFVVELWVKKPVKIGGITYPRGTFVSGIGTLFRMGGEKMVVEVNSSKVCGNLGQEGQTLEIFEIKLCEDSEINGIKIPGGSKVTFIPHKSRAGQDWFDISCINPGAKMEFRGVSFKKGEKLLTLSKTFRPEESDDSASECEVNVWDREIIETLKKSGMIK